MVIVDTSVWVHHLRWGSAQLKVLLHETQVMCHDFILGELACGSLKNRREILSLLTSFPRAPVVNQEEVLYFIESHSLMAAGIGFIDAHLLASAQLINTPLWTLDHSLKRVAEKLELSH